MLPPFIAQRLVIIIFILVIRLHFVVFPLFCMQPSQIYSYFIQMKGSEDSHLEKNGQIDISLLKEMLTNQRRPSREWTKGLIKRFIGIVKNEPNVLRIHQPVVIIGDIHGQFYDLLKIMSLFPPMDPIPKESFLFLGDYVDRGPQGVEVVLVLMALKVKFPEKVFMLRGNHQTRQMTQIMNFYQQAVQKYDQDVYFDIMDAFDALPLVCIVNDNYFCVHGGITSLGESIEELQKLNRMDEVPLKGSICDLVWSDPVQQDDGKTYNGDLFIPNYQRNCSIFFGGQHARNFLKKTKLVTIIRAHEVQIEGYKQHMWPKWNDIPMVYTVFSAPNYCGSYGNLGAILTIQEKCKFSVRQFKESNPKYYVPAKFNAFNFSLKKMYDILDTTLLRLIRKWTALKMPELKDLPPEQILHIFLKSEKCKELILTQNIGEDIQLVKSEHYAVKESSLFRKSLDYFSKTQQRPSQLHFKSQ